MATSPIAGRVVDRTSGLPVPDALVATGGAEPVRTGPDGTFELYLAPSVSRPVVLRAGAEGYLSVRVIVPVSGDGHWAGPGDIRLGPAPRLHGVVQNAVSGAEVPGARLAFRADAAPADGAVLLFAPWAELPAGADVSGTSGESGRFELALGDQVVSGWLEAGAAGFAASRLRVAPSDADRTLRVRLQPASRITGRILMPSGSPIPDATVRLGLDQESSPRSETRSAEDGRYTFDAVEGGRAYWLVVSQERFVPASRGPFWIGAASSLPGLDVRLEPAGSITGTVSASTGEPAPGLLVTAQAVEIRSPTPRPAPSPSQPSSSQPDPRTQFRKLFDALDDGAFANVAHTRPSGAEEALKRLLSSAATTSPDGSFALGSLRPGIYEVRVLLNEDKPLGSRQPVEVRAGRVTEAVDLLVSAQARVRGRVLDAGGQPIEGASVLLLTNRPPLAILQTSATVNDIFDEARVAPHASDVVQTDSAGRYEFGPVPEGHYWISAFHGPLRSRREPVAAPAEDVDLVIESLGLVLGTAVSAEDGRPIEQFFAGAAAAGARGEPLFLSFAFADGAFALEHAVEGDLTVQVRAPGYWPWKAEGLRPKPGQRVVEVLAELRRVWPLTGVVRDGSGQPVAGAEVRGWQGPALSAGGLAQDGSVDFAVLDSPSGGLDPYGPGTVTAEDGSFRLEGLAPGSVLLWVEAPGFAPAVRKLDPAGAEPFAPVEIPLDPGHSVSGTIVGPQGEPLAGRVVEARGFGSFESGPAGRFELRHLPAGRHRLLVYSAADWSRIEASQEVEVGPDVEGLRIQIGD